MLRGLLEQTSIWVGNWLLLPSLADSYVTVH